MQTTRLKQNAKREGKRLKHYNGPEASKVLKSIQTTWMVFMKILKKIIKINNTISIQFRSIRIFLHPGIHFHIGYLDNLHPGIHFDLRVLGHFGLKYKTIKTNKIHNEF